MTSALLLLMAGTALVLITAHIDCTCLGRACKAAQLGGDSLEKRRRRGDGGSFVCRERPAKVHIDEDREVAHGSHRA